MLLSASEVSKIITETCEACGVPQFRPYIGWAYTDKLRTTMGKAAMQRGPNGGYTFKLTLSNYVCSNSSIAEQIETVRHEACHLIDFYQCYVLKTVSNTGKHGYNWQRLMMLCGASGAVKHNNPVKRNKPQVRYAVYCSCKTHAVSGRLVANMRKGQKYACKSCRTELTFEKVK
jgi:predicted SprT family Zn-dependent metalloprotease